MPSSPSSSRARLDSMDEEERESAALHVRERIYVTFATLAVALTIGIVLLAATLVLARRAPHRAADPCTSCC